jgi:hypothetical protein
LVGDAPGMNQPSNRSWHNAFGRSPETAQNSTRFKLRL